MVYFDAINNVWVISEGTRGVMWKDALASERVNHEIYTTRDIIVSENSKEFVSANAQCLYITRKHTDGNNYYLMVER